MSSKNDDAAYAKATNASLVRYVKEADRIEVKIKEGDSEIHFLLSPGVADHIGCAIGLATSCVSGYQRWRDPGQFTIADASEVKKDVLGDPHHA